MKAWNYRTIVIDTNRDALAVILNQVGEEGWELVSTMKLGDGSEGALRLILFLKRETKLVPSTDTNKGE